jgi:cellulose synthase/poly-beta-1,6-N-acetylglucosamine synthase-like glycosyltransferase
MEMDLIAHGILGLVTLSCVFPLAMLAVEAFSAICARRSMPASSATAPLRLAVLIPAHNEEQELPATLTDLVSEMHAGDRCIVIADNCEDGTARVAGAYPVEVLVRHDEKRRGKGFALDHGLAHLRADPPDVVLVIDADCRVAAGSLHALAAVAAATGRPVQGGDLLYPPAHSRISDRVSAFAFMFKNHIRPLGLSQWGGPCLLFGTGMGFPWSVLADISLATTDAVEDMQLAVKLALAGKPPLYVPVPCVSGTLPASAQEARTQRQRWEHGHVRTMLKFGPRLVWAGLHRRQWNLMLLGADLMVPPLSFLAVIVMAAVGFDLVAWWLTGIWLWFSVLAAAIGMAAVAILLAWHCFGRDLLSFKDVALTPVYIARKIPIYLALLVRPQKTWSSSQPTSAAGKQGGDSEDCSS